LTSIIAQWLLKAEHTLFSVRLQLVFLQSVLSGSILTNKVAQMKETLGIIIKAIQDCGKI
jgi:hypothetical protein